MIKLRQSMRKVNRLVELAPEYALHPGRLRSVLKGVHPGVLPTVDQVWLRAFNPGTILDVGANTGQFSFAAHTVFPSAQIYAFEPLPSCVEQLETRMRDTTNFKLFNTAIGSSDGRIDINESTSSPSSSILDMSEAHTEAFPWTGGGRQVEVFLRRLDSLLPDLALIEPVLLKIDVQGYSMEVLRGATETLKLCELVVVETSVVTLYDGESTFDEVFEFMRDAGFKFAGVLDQLKHPSTAEILQIDAIFKRTFSPNERS